MPAKKRAGKKFQNRRYPVATREAAADFEKARVARKKLGEKALNKPKSSSVHRAYKKVDTIYQKTGRRLARLTGFKWKK